jgi:crotonobetainyl-CoA:carnitine CoA-transferase CaiB-like acyl-CoA transferase
MNLVRNQSDKWLHLLLLRLKITMSEDQENVALGPLRGIRVIEICSTIAGPACTRLMGDFGAEVIKIEPPEGDPVRQMGQHIDDVSLYAASLLRNKKSVVLNLKSPEDLSIAKAMIQSADILVENNRPGVMERLGLGFEELSKTNPGLVMVRISGFGQTGPYAPRPGYGAICEAVGGVRHMTGDPDRPPARGGDRGGACRGDDNSAPGRDVPVRRRHYD